MRPSMMSGSSLLLPLLMLTVVDLTLALSRPLHDSPRSESGVAKRNEGPRQLELTESRQETMHLGAFLGTLLLLTAPVLFPAYSAAQKKNGRQDRPNQQQQLISNMMNSLETAVNNYQRNSQNFATNIGSNLRKNTQSMVKAVMEDLPRSVVQTARSGVNGAVRGTQTRLSNMMSNARNMARGLRVNSARSLRRLGQMGGETMKRMSAQLNSARRRNIQNIKRFGQTLGSMANTARNFVDRTRRRLGKK